MSVKYFIFAGGRWREVCIETGAVSGWGSCTQFIYHSRGRLKMARKLSVLRGLRALADGEPDTVQEGPRLSHLQRTERDLGTDRLSVASEHCMCCRHDYHSQKKQIISVHKSISTQTSVQNCKKKNPLRDELGQQVKSSKLTAPRKLTDHKGTAEFKASPLRARRRQSSINEHHIVVQTIAEIHDHVNSRLGNRLQQEPSSDDSDFKTKPSTRKKKPSPSKKKLKVAQGNKAVSKNKKHSEKFFIEAIQKHNVDQTPSQTQPISSDICKELIIDEADVVLLRNFLEKYSDSNTLRRFDEDDGFKRTLFYRINPLVNVQRCSRIQQILKAEDERSLKDFASQLGLRSVSEQSQDVRYKTRKVVMKANRKVGKLDYRDVDKENMNRNNLEVSSRRHIKKLSQTRRKIKNIIKNHKSKQRVLIHSLLKRSSTLSVSRNEEPLSKVVEISSDSNSSLETNTEHKKLQDILRRQPTTTISKRPSRRSFVEYSGLEDQAIVSWLSLGSRSRGVNGNQVWRELQESYQRLTGQWRSWHSLRNRYLRYILPQLHTMALPHTTVTELRAAAAAGKLKGRREVRRNSMFPSPAVRGASSRRPRAVLRDSSPETVVEPKSPARVSVPQPPGPPVRAAVRQSPRLLPHALQPAVTHSPNKKLRATPKLRKLFNHNNMI